MEQKYIIALELSGSQVKGAAATVSAGAYGTPYPTVECIAYEDKVDCVHYGRVQNLIDAANHVNFVLQRLANDPKLGGRRITAAYVGVGGRSFGSVKKEGKVELGRDVEITEEILQHVYADAKKTVPGDRKVLEIVPRRFYVDNQPMANPVGAIGSRVRGEFTIVTCNPANQRNLEMLFNDRVNLPVKKYVVTPLAVGQLVLGDEEKAVGCILVDMGAQTTTISIYKDRALQYLATLPLGSYNITHDIAVGTNTTDERADTLKITQGNAMADASAATDSARINCYVQARAGEIVANIMQQLEYAGYKAADLPGGYIITGRGSKLRNFDKLLEAQSKMSVRRASIPGIVNVGVGDPNDFTSLVAIVDAASKSADPSCTEMPKPQPRAADQYVPSYGSGNSLDESGDDDGWDRDDDENERRSKERERKAERERKRRERKQAEERERQRRRQERSEVTENLDDDDSDDGDEPKRQGGLRGIFQRITDVLKYDPAEDDTDID